MIQLICKNLCIGYDGKALVKDLNFLVNAGDYLCIVGENGSGKSTLMKTILGLQSSISGKIFLHPSGKLSSPDARAAAASAPITTEKKGGLRQKL